MKNILVVDDDEHNLKLMDAMIRAEGHDCRTAASGAIALARCGERLPDLILLDIMMPGLDGYEVASRLKSQDSTRNIPIIFLTALSNRDSRIRGLEVGAEEFVSKPVDHLELSIRMRNLLRIKEYNDILADHNKVLDAQVRARTVELRETQLEIVRSLGRAAEYRDNETGLHILRMSRPSQLMALAAGQSDEKAEMLLNAAPMHDIGKVGIPDRILLKPGKLDAEEWAVMKTHSAIGAGILQARAQSPLMAMAASIALCHHEKWDGSGYPNALAGEAIPIEARVVAIADVFDAITSERPYKKAWSIEPAVAEIERLSGSHFEPRLVAIFQECLPDILAIRAQHLDEPLSGPSASVA